MHVQEDIAGSARDTLSLAFADPDLAARAQIAWAIGELKSRLDARGVTLRQSSGQAGDGAIVVFTACDDVQIARTAALTSVALPNTPESFAIFRGLGAEANRLYVHGGDIRGLVYAITELADRVRYLPALSDALDFAEPMVETPEAKVRSISRCFQSEIEDLSWFHDRAGWEEYLTLLATHRFNRFSLTFGKQYNYPYGNEFVSDVYFHLAYPFLVAVPGHAVSITNLTEAERARNLETLQFIAREADRRGLDFQLALWTQSYDFADCPNARHQITGLGPDNIAAYCRDSLTAILAAVPEISGLTLRVHVECGIPEGDYEFWQTYFSAVTDAGRPIRLDLHAKGIDAHLIETALATGMPVGISPKYTSEHMGLPYHQASIRTLERVTESEARGVRLAETLYTGDDEAKHAGKWRFSEGSRRFMRYSYGDLLRDDRPYSVVFRIWPGTTRILLWGDPVLAGGYGRNAGFCGAQGVELCEPLSFKGRMGTGQPGGRLGYQEHCRFYPRDWQKFEYTYRVWGRSLFNPEADPAAFHRFLEARFGAAASSCGNAIASASRILPLITLAHTPTASNNSYWPEMVENMSIVHPAPRLPYGYELAQPARFGTVGSCDPQLFFSPQEFAARLHDGTGVRKIAPLTWANWLEQHATTAALELRRACAGEPEAELQLVSVDVTILAAIGRFFADKIRAAVFWEYYLLSGEEQAAREAIEHYRRAHDAWAQAAAVCQDVYLPDITYGPHSWLRGRWDDRLPAIAADLAAMEAIVAEGRLSVARGPRETGEVERILNWTTPQIHAARHQVPAGFVHGAALDIAVTSCGAGRRAVVLHYRHVDQSDTWRAADMRWKDGAYRARIPAAVTAAPYPIMYYFEFLDAGPSSFTPGLSEDPSTVPYFHVAGKLG